MTSTSVKTPLGVLRGEEHAGVRMFRGVRFVEPPVGPLRFKPPVKIKAWDGERDATRFVDSPMQSGEVGVPHSEDCLGLNIWTPTGKGPYPVFVWIHGGGYTGGHAFDPGVDGSQFVRNDIIVVTVPYRLGIFGFLDVGPLLGPDYAASSNNAVRDLIAGLQWVRENIAAFGGDPDRVTIGGESAGGKLTCTLMGVPSAQPLFQQMISESGGAERVWSKPEAAKVTDRFGQLWRKQMGRDIQTLLTAPAADLLQAQQTFFTQGKEMPLQIPCRPLVDGDLFPDYPIKTIAAGSARGKRLLIGSNLDESAIFIGAHPASTVTQSQLGNVSLATFSKIYPKYSELYPKLSDERRHIRAVSAQAYWVPSIRVGDAQSTNGPTFMYRLDFAESGGRYSGLAYHSLDVGMVWDKPHQQITNASEEAGLSKQIHQAWVAFIKGQTPAAPGLVDWPQYRSDSRSTMILNVQSHVEERPNEAELRLWDGAM